MLVFLWICIFLSIYIFFVRDNFFSELLISFLPYICVCCWLVIIILCIFLYYFTSHKVGHKSLNIFLTIILLISSIAIFGLYTQEFFWFYSQNSEKIRLDQQNWIKVFYANILYTNADFIALQKKIEDENPDIVILVEFSDAHEKEMKTFFKDNYPYMNRNSRSVMLAWDVVFSKIPLDVNIEKIENDWTRKYSHIKILCDNLIIPSCTKWVDMYVVHTAAPVSMKNYEMRNSQLKKIKNWYNKQESKSAWNPTIIIWDFNLSPWSYNYKILTSNWRMLNVLRYQKPNYTRSLFQQWIFRSHIDQLFISPEITVTEVKVESLTWSDHRSFSFSFWTRI